MSFESKITLIETKRLRPAFKEVEKIFSKVWLPSHNQIHHLRVWGFAKDLLKAYLAKGYTFNADYLEALFIACMFHDTGLTVTLSERHGNESAEIARCFLQRYPLNSEVYKEELLEAIILHDDKSYNHKKGEELEPGIYQVLTVADDLDALGALGLFRYIEIYWSRGIRVEQISTRIEQNIKSRIRFIQSKIKFDAKLEEKHFERYQRAFYNLKMLGVSELSEISTLIEHKVEINSDLLMRSFTHSSKLHDFFSEMVIEENFFVKTLPGVG